MHNNLVISSFFDDLSKGLTYFCLVFFIVHLNDWLLFISPMVHLTYFFCSNYTNNCESGCMLAIEIVFVEWFICWGALFLQIQQCIIRCPSYILDYLVLKFSLFAAISLALGDDISHHSNIRFFWQLKMLIK